MAPVTEPDPTESSPHEEPEGATPLHLPMSPVGEDVPRPVALAAAAVAALLLAVASVAGYAATLGLTLVLALVLAATWPAGSGSLTPGATAVVLGASGLLIVGSALREDLRWVAAAVAFGAVLSFFHQLLRAPGREGLVLSLLASFGGLALLASAATMAALSHRPTTRGFVVVAMAAVMAALLADLLGGATVLRPFLSIVAFVAALAAAVVASVVAAHWLDPVDALDAAGLGAAVGTVSWSFRRVLSGQAAMLGARAQVATGVGSVFVTGALVHLYGVIA
jgi:hypothetical protein